ncbi:MAG: tetratricopeptide repeat-containing sensor histidine kinase [Cyclobacteriaceae bacterium]
MRHILTSFTLFLAVLSSCAQVSSRELMNELERSKLSSHDSLYYELFRSTLYSNGDLLTAKQYAMKSHKLSRRFGHSYLHAKSSRALGMLNNRLEDFDSARYYYNQGIEISSINDLTDLLVYTTNDLGRHYQNLDMYDSALKYYHVSLEHATRLDMKEDMAFALNNMGLVFYYLNNFNEALENLEGALSIRKNNDLGGKGIVLKNIALVYNDQGRFEEALTLLTEVEQKYTGEFDDFQLSDLYDDIAYAHYNTNNIDVSLIYYQKAIQNGRASGNRRAVANSLHHFGLFSMTKGDYLLAEDQLKEALQIAEELKLKRLKRELYSTFQNLYNVQGDLDKVIEYQNKYMAIKDSIFNEQMANNLKEIQLDAQRKQSEVIIQQKDVEIKRVRLITGLVGVIALLMIVLSFLIYRNYRASHRMKLVLEKEVESRTGELVKSNQELTKMTHEYDQLVYRASHDIRGPLATLMGLTNIAKQDTKEPLRVRDYLSKIESTANGLNQTLSQLMETNRIRNFPIVVEEVTLDSLVETIYGSFKNLNHFPLISLRTEKGDWKKPLRSDKNLINFVLTKLLDNAFRYFSVNKLEKYIKVSWSQDEHNTTIMVEDNGSGIDSQAKEKIFQLFYVASDVHGSGLGLFLAQMAAQRLGGRIVLARSSDPTIFKLVISTHLDEARAADNPLMAVS